MFGESKERTITNNTPTNVAYVTVGSSGTYLLHAIATFATNNTGFRRAQIATERLTAAYGTVHVGASNSDVTVLQVSSIYAVPFNAGASVYLFLQQNSGGNLIAKDIKICAIKIK